MKLIHVTDTHLVSRDEVLYGLDPSDRLAACIADLNKHHADADLIVITGDLSHFGDRRSYLSLREILADSKVPVKLLLGNHDVQHVFQEVFPERVSEDPKNGFQQVLDTDVGRLFFLDTTMANSHAGHYSEARLDWLVERLEERPEQAAFLFMHHPPFKVEVPAMDRIGLVNMEVFKTRLKPFLPRIRHLFFGHVHRPMAGSWCGVPFSSLRGMNHQVWLDFSQAEEVPGSHEPPAYAVVLIDAERVIIHFHDFLYDGPRFQLSDVGYNFWEEQQRRSTTVGKKKKQVAVPEKNQ
jgi:3',5'-cyclic-AMP phosphodiesterase